MRTSSLHGRSKRATCKQSKANGFLMMFSLIRRMTRIALPTFWSTDFVYIFVETRVGGNPESHYAFRHISCPTLSMMTLTMQTILDEDSKIILIQIDFKHLLRQELGETRKAASFQTQIKSNLVHGESNKWVIYIQSNLNFRCVHWWCNQLKQLMLMIASSTEVTPPLRGV